MRDRRAHGARSAVVRRVLEEVFTRGWFTVETAHCTKSMGLTPEACRRIMAELERAGVVQQTRPGTWKRGLA